MKQMPDKPYDRKTDYRTNAYQTGYCCLCDAPTKGKDPKGWTTGYAKTDADLCLICTRYLKGEMSWTIQSRIAGEFSAFKTKMAAIHAALLVLRPEVLQDSHVQEKAGDCKITLNRFCVKDDDVFCETCGYYVDKKKMHKDGQPCVDCWNGIYDK